MKRIGIFLGDVHENGGINRVTWILANRLNAYYEMYILSSIQNKTERYRYAEDIKIEFLFQEQKPVRTRFFQMTRGIRSFLKKNRIDILICAGEIFFPPCVLAVKGTGTKLVCWEHSNVSVQTEHKFQRECRWIGAKNADLVVPLTKADARMYREKYRVKRCRAIYNPVDDRLLSDITYPIDSRKIISVGRLCDQKNFELLVDVAGVFLTRNPDWSWDIFGEGENRAAIQKKIDAAGLRERLVLRGDVPDLYERYQEYAMLVMTSRFEGFPMVLLESTAKGIPVVAFDVLTGPNEIIADGETGFLIPPEDIAAMAEKMQRLADAPELRKGMSARCLETREQFSCQTIVENWRKMLNDL